MSTPLAPEQLATIQVAATCYTAQGYGIVRQFLSAGEIATLAAEVQLLVARTDLIDTNNLRCRCQNDCETGACVFEAFDLVIDLAPAARRSRMNREFISC